MSLAARIGLAIVLLCLSIMNARGLRNAGGDGFSSAAPNSIGNGFELTYGYEHGWPLIWLESEQRNATPVSSFLNQAVKDQEEVRYAWPFNATPLQVHWRSLTINLVIAALIFSLVFVAIKVRGRKRQGFKFSLLELSLLMLVASLAVANFQYHRRVGDKEKETLSTLSEGHDFLVLRRVWNGPAWLSALIGQPKFLDVFRHVDQISFCPIDLDDQLSEELLAFPYTSEVSLSGDPGLKQLEILSQLRKISKIQVTDVRSAFLGDSFVLRRGLGVTDDAKAILARRRSDKNRNTGEPFDLRIQRLNDTFPNVTELTIDSSRSGVWNRWPRAFDLLRCCPNLKRVSLTGNQFIPEDLFGLPSSVEEIEHGFRLVGSQPEELQALFPDATIEQNLPRISFKHWSGVAWVQVGNQINRRRKQGWKGSRFEPGTLDLSSTETDPEFVEKIKIVFPTVGTIIFGEFDSSETAMALVRQCNYVLNIETNGFEITFEEAMQLPAELDVLEIAQGSITAEEFVTLIERKMPRSLTISQSTFSDEERALILGVHESCRVTFRNKLPMQEATLMEKKEFPIRGPFE